MRLELRAKACDEKPRARRIGRVSMTNTKALEKLLERVKGIARNGRSRRHIFPGLNRSQQFSSRS